MRSFRAVALLFSVAGLLLAASCHDASAQFKKDAFSQQYNNDKTESTDSMDVLFSFKDYFGGLSHKNTIKIGTSFAGSALVIGGQQIYNEQYWKLPIAYGGIAAGVAGGITCNATGHNDQSKYWFIGAGAVYWATLMDGVVNYKPSGFPHPGKATIYSILLPGLGQIYNHEWWKLPIYLGGMGFAVHMYIDNKANYNRFNQLYEDICDGKYTGSVTSEQAQYYKSVYRRYRDYSLLAIFGVYLLQVIDANIFAYMHDFDVDENLALKVSPTVIVPENQLALSPSLSSPAVGLRMGFTF